MITGGRGNLCPLWFHMLRTNCLGPAFPFFRIHCFRQDRCVTCAVTSQTISYLSMSHFLVPTNWVGGRGLMMLHSSGHSLNIIQSLGFHNVQSRSRVGTCQSTMEHRAGFARFCFCNITGVITPSLPAWSDLWWEGCQPSLRQYAD